MPGHADGHAGAASATTPASEIYYRSIQHPSGEKHDRLTIHDYLWRWDTDWFWCSRAFGAQNPTVRRLLAAALPPQQLLLEADRLRPAVRHRRPDREAQRPPAPRTGGAGRRGADRADRGVHRLVPGRTSRSSRSGCAHCGYVTTPWLAALSDPARTHLRQHRILVVGSCRPRAWVHQSHDRGRRSANWTGTSRCTRMLTTRPRSSMNCTAARPTRRSRKPTTPIHGCSICTRRRCNDDDDLQGSAQHAKQGKLTLAEILEIFTPGTSCR